MPHWTPPVRCQIHDTDLCVHPLALGCGGFGRTLGGDASLRVLDRHRDLGGNFLDTADAEGGETGPSEAVIGAWLRSRGGRDGTVIATRIGRDRVHPGLSRQSIIDAVHASLERLGTDRIDLLYLQPGDDDSVPLVESLAAADTLIRRGEVRYLAASSWSAGRLVEARVLAASGLPRFVAVGAPYSLVHRNSFESELSLVARGQGLAVFPYFALADGFLTGRYRTRSDFTATLRGARAAAHANRKSRRVLDTVGRIATEHTVDPASIALAWLLARDGVVAPVAGANHPRQVDALVDAAGIRLDSSDLSELDRVSA